MNWEAIGATGQVFGALALIFVVVQVRHVRAEMTKATLNPEAVRYMEDPLAQPAAEAVAASRMQSKHGSTAHHAN